MFFAHDIAGWVGIPAGVVIAAMIILRRRGMAAWGRRKQARAAGRADLPGAVTSPHTGARVTGAEAEPEPGRQLHQQEGARQICR